MGGIAQNKNPNATIKPFGNDKTLLAIGRPGTAHSNSALRGSSLPPLSLVEEENPRRTRRACILGQVAYVENCGKPARNQHGHEDDQGEIDETGHPA